MESLKSYSAIESTIRFFPLTDLILGGVIEQNPNIQTVGVAATYLARPLDHLIQLVVFPVFFVICSYKNFQREVEKMTPEEKMEKFPKLLAIHLLAIWPLEFVFSILLLPFHIFGMTVYRLANLSQFSRFVSNPQTHIPRYFLKRQELFQKIEEKNHVLRFPANIPEKVKKLEEYKQANLVSPIKFKSSKEIFKNKKLKF